jgi:hypothetical protein
MRASRNECGQAGWKLKSRAPTRQRTSLKRLFVVTAEGARRLKEVRRVRERIWRAIEAKR